MLDTTIREGGVGLQINARSIRGTGTMDQGETINPSGVLLGQWSILIPQTHGVMPLQHRGMMLKVPQVQIIIRRLDPFKTAKYP